MAHKLRLKTLQCGGLRDQNRWNIDSNIARTPTKQKKMIVNDGEN